MAEEEAVDQDFHPMSREEEDAQIHDEHAAQEKQVAQGVQEDEIAAPIPDDDAEDEEEAQQPRRGARSRTTDSGDDR